MKDRVPFVEIVYKGPRFDGGRLPVEFLPDFSVYQEMLVEIAKQIWRDIHPARARIPKNFDKYFELTFSEVRSGSAIAFLPRENFDLEPLFGPEQVVDIFDVAQQRLLDAIQTANRGQKIESLPSYLLPKFNQFGKRLSNEEKIVLNSRSPSSKQREQTVSYTRATRETILSRAGLSVERIIEGFGIITGVSETRSAVSVLCELGEFWFRVRRPQIRDTFDGKIGDIVEFSIEAIVREATHIKRVLQYHSIDLIEYGKDVNRIKSRLANFRNLRSGWLEGTGESIDERAIEIGFDMARFLNSVYTNLRIYPEESGGIQIEFEHNGLDISYDILKQSKIILHVYNKSEKKSFEKSYKGIDATLLKDAMNLHGLLDDGE